MIFFSAEVCNNGYYVYTDELFSNTDTRVANYIGMELKDYVKILKSFRAKCSCFGEYFFSDEEDCQKCCDYLNEIYGPIIVLTGGFLDD